jgi:hypothetical protein
MNSPSGAKYYNSGRTSVGKGHAHKPSDLPSLQEEGSYKDKRFKLQLI